MSDYFRVRPEDLVSHAADVGRIAQDIRVVSSVSTPLPGSAYGVIGQLFASSLVETDGHMSASLGRIARDTGRHAQLLSRTAEAYQRRERDNLAHLNQAGTRTGAAPGAPAGGPSGGASSGGSSGGGRSGGSTSGGLESERDKAGRDRSVRKEPGRDLSAGKEPARDLAAGTGTQGGKRDGFPKDLGALSDRRLRTLRHSLDHQLGTLEDKQDQLGKRRETVKDELRRDDLGDHDRARLEHRLHELDHQRNQLDHQHNLLKDRYDRVRNQLGRRDPDGRPAPPLSPAQRRWFEGHPDPGDSPPGPGNPSWAAASQD